MVIKIGFIEAIAEVAEVTEVDKTKNAFSFRGGIFYDWYYKILK